MIIESKKNGACVIPCVERGVGIKIVNKVKLIPGNNVVPDKIWEQARPNVLADIKRGDLVEVAATIKKEPIIEKVKDPETGKETEKKIGEKTVVEGKTLDKMEPKEAAKIVENTFNMDTLKGWKDTIGKESVRILIINQIESIEKFGEEKAKKKREAKDSRTSD